ncbi:TetR/AcrR family transcriptional regulator [Rhodococcus sp. NPDC058505]|uniref:TetR/AcrR family transcriptional regulator n=1 Tax=unclassified Rhodococcus (in: high G+C Gram-positive bacteria) TaxID=192944 RepID=UPI00365C9030
MSRPPAARAKLLDAFVTILIEQGERAATIEAVATAAGVSKGGLLYHFGSKDALIDGLLDHLTELAAEDAQRMRAAPEGAAAYYVRTSNFENSRLDRAIIAATRLSQGENTAAQQALLRIQQGWMDALTDEISDPSAARAVMLLGDGLYYRAAHSGTEFAASPQEMEDLLGVVRRIVGP